MILHDYQCEICEEITEHLVDSKQNPDTQYCPICNGVSHKIVSLSMTSPVDAGWLSTVLEVVDKHPDKAHCQEFLKHPTRANYKNWMKGEGLRPLEPGEKVAPKVDKVARKERIKDKMMKRYQERNAITVK